MSTFLGFFFIAGILLVLLGWALRSPNKLASHRSDPASLEEKGRRHATYVSLIRQAMLPADLEFLSARGSAKLVQRARRERRQVALMYLSQLRQDFEWLLRLARVVASLSPEVAAAQELERFGIGVQFLWRYQATRLTLRLGLIPLPQVAGLSEMVSEFAVHVDVAMKDLGERAVLAAELASSLDRRGVNLA